MTILDLIAEFRTTYDLGSSGLPGFEDDEIKELLEVSQSRIISQKFGGNNVYGTKFPDTRPRLDDLHRLMKSDETITVASTTRGYKLVILPDDFLHMVELNLIYSGGTIEQAEQIDYSKVQRFQSSRRNQGAYIKNPVYVYEAETGSPNYDTTIRLYFDTTEETSDPLATIKCLYISKPTQSMTSIGDATILRDFPDNVYHEIVALTVNQAIEIASPNKSQISNQNLNKIE